MVVSVVGQEHDLWSLRDFSVAWAHGWLCLPAGMCLLARLPNDAGFMHWLSLLHFNDRAARWADAILPRYEVDR